MALALVLATGAIGLAIQANSGFYSADAFHFAMLGFALALLPACVPLRASAVQYWARRLFVPCALCVIALDFGLLHAVPPGFYLRPQAVSALGPFHAALALAAVVAAFGIARVGRATQVSTAIVLLTFVVLGAWMVRASPAPHVDVWNIHQESLNALHTGINPYTITFRNIYGSPTFYAQGIATRDRLLFGYVYPPWTLIVAEPGYLLGGDYRYSFVTAIVFVAAAIAWARGNRWGLAAATLFLFTPRSFFVVEQGWTEPALLLPMAAVVLFACLRMPRALALSLGVAAASKQYAILALPALFLLVPTFGSWRAFGRAIPLMLVSGAAVTFPLAATNFRAFWHNVFGMQLGQPLRPDSLSIPVWWLSHFGSPMPRPVQSALPLTVIALVAARAPRTASGFAWAAGTIYLTFFLFRQGFCNYFYAVIGMYCLSIGACSARSWFSGPKSTAPA